ncbi:MAG: LysR family transcriptional regulator, partial [Brevibacterium aurantiacum]
MNIDHVKALAAVVDEGTVEGGAFVLGVTPSATSQRIRTLESRIGQVLIRRTNPITVTEAGEAVLKYAREIELLESETMDRLHGIDIDAPDGIGKDAGAAPNQRRRVPTVLRIGVNADSLSTWFRPIFAEVADWDDIVIRIEVADQDKALPLLTSGEV